MRVLATCLAGFLGLAALATMAACSDSTDVGAAGAGGAAGGGSGGKVGSAGSTTGAAGAECGFQTADCSTCLGDKCGEQANACSDDSACATGLYALPNCVCDPSKDPETCIGKFVSDNGDVAEKLANCYSLNCAEACQ
jgi:hypothetical protein